MGYTLQDIINIKGLSFCDDLTDEELMKIEKYIHDNRDSALSDEEISFLLDFLPKQQDSCYGLAGGLLHLIERNKNYTKFLYEKEGLWIERLKRRIENSKHDGLQTD